MYRLASASLHILRRIIRGDACAHFFITSQLVGALENALLPDGSILCFLRWERPECCLLTPFHRLLDRPYEGEDGFAYAIRKLVNPQPSSALRRMSL